MKTIWRQTREARDKYTLEDGSYVVSVTAPVFTTASLDPEKKNNWGYSPLGGRFVMAPVVMLDDRIFQSGDNVPVRGRLLEACYLPYCAPQREESGFGANLSVLCNLVIESVQQEQEGALAIQLFALRTFHMHKLTVADPSWFQAALSDTGRQGELVSKLNSYMDRTLNIAMEVCALGWPSLRERYLGGDGAPDQGARQLVLPCTIEKDLRDSFEVGDTEFLSLDDYLHQYRSHLQNRICFAPEHVGETQEMSQ